MIKIGLVILKFFVIDGTYMLYGTTSYAAVHHGPFNVLTINLHFYNNIDK